MHRPEPASQLRADEPALHKFHANAWRRGDAMHRPVYGAMRKERTASCIHGIGNFVIQRPALLGPVTGKSNLARLASDDNALVVHTVHRLSRLFSEERDQSRGFIRTTVHWYQDSLRKSVLRARSNHRMPQRERTWYYACHRRQCASDERQFKSKLRSC